MINDTMGHHIGDEALKMTAYLLRTSIPQTDFVARFGGVEFYIISESDTDDKVHELIQKIEYNFELHNSYSQSFKLSPSIGYTLVEAESTKTVHGLQELVDVEMYKNKMTRKERNKLTIRSN